LEQSVNNSDKRKRNLELLMVMVLLKVLVFEFWSVYELVLALLVV
jgi:hypothetical protein